MTIHLGIDGRELVAGVRSGIGRYVQEVLRAAKSRGWSCTLYRDQDGQPEALAAEVRHVTIRRGWTQWWDQVMLPRQLVRDRVSIFLSPYYKGPLIAACPVVLTIHDLFFIGYPGEPRPLRDALMTHLGQLYAQRAAAIIADSNYSKRAVVDLLKVPAAKVSVVPVALGPEFLPQSMSSTMRDRYRLHDPYVLYVGNFKPHKNLPRLLEAYAAMDRPLRARYRLVLAGGDRANRPMIKRLARGLGIAERLVLPGLIDDADLPAVYSGASLFVLPSLYEGFGLPVLEAMACGAPVAAANRTAIPEVLGGTGLSFDPENPQSITMALEQGLASEAIRMKLRQEGLARARAFTPQATSERVLDVLERTLANHMQVAA